MSTSPKKDVDGFEKSLCVEAVSGVWVCLSGCGRVAEIDLATVIKVSLRLPDEDW